MKNLRKSNGSVSVLVLVTILTMIAVLVTAYMVGNTQRRAQLQSEIKLKEVYEAAIDNAGKIYEDVNNKKIALDKKTLPYTSSTRPYLPNDGFSRIIGTDLNNGLVIEDSEGNQFVWVEVPKTTAVYATSGINITTFTSANYTTIKNDLINYAKDYRKTDYNDKWYDGCGIETSAKYTELYNKMLKSVYEHGGFWIGRYEFGIKENVARTTANDTFKESSTIGQTPVIQANKVPYDFLRCYQAQTLASTFAPASYTSSLLFGIQWDLVCKHLEVKGKNPGSSASSIKEAIQTNSIDWANTKDSTFKVTNTKAMYSTDLKNWVKINYRGYTKPSDSAVALTTGASERNKLMNIYDLAGGLSEWTLEKSWHESYFPTLRGGDYWFNASFRSAATRDCGAVNYSDAISGARATIY
ncbi:MAG: hypothetical protein ACLTXD_04275 [Clostridia bacterium]